MFISDSTCPLTTPVEVYYCTAAHGAWRHPGHLSIRVHPWLLVQTPVHLCISMAACVDGCCCSAHLSRSSADLTCRSKVTLLDVRSTTPRDRQTVFSSTNDPARAHIHRDTFSHLLSLSLTHSHRCVACSGGGVRVDKRELQWVPPSWCLGVCTEWHGS